MTTKPCSICKKIKLLSEYNKNCKKKDGLQDTCKDCNKERSAAYYKRNTESHKQITKDQKIAQRARNTQYLWDYLLKHPCLDCGETDPIVLEFDHVKDKIGAVGRLAADGCAISTLESEIKKCEIRCANCHRRKTAKQLGWYKNINTGP